MEKLLVDALGEQCPIPVVKATKAIAGMNEDGIVEVHVDNETAVQNLLRMAAGKGFDAKSEKKEDRHFVVTIAVSQKELPGAADAGANAPGAGAADAPQCIPDLRSDYVVAVGKATMGTGSDELGATLMKGFLYALSQQEKLPSTVLFFNGGARLTTAGSASIEDLKTLEAQGVEILTCGTCLDYYGIKDKLEVGGVTNMYVIVEKLTTAAKVVKP